MPFLNVVNGNPVECGLIHYIDLRNLGQCFPVPVPLKWVDLNVTLVNFVAHIELKQVYVNQEKVPIEASYFFPVEEECAVVDFEAEVDGRVIKTEVKAKDQAQKEYKEAVEKNQTALMLEETKPDIFHMKVRHSERLDHLEIMTDFIVKDAVFTFF